MKCLRCGYCCTRLCAVIVKNPDKGISEDNLMMIGMSGEVEKCPHLLGDKPGEYSCSIHNRDWYPETPCAQYQSHWPERTCRMGRALVENEWNGQSFNSREKGKLP